MSIWYALWRIGRKNLAEDVLARRPSSCGPQDLRYGSLVLGPIDPKGIRVDDLVKHGRARGPDHVDHFALSVRYRRRSIGCMTSEQPAGGAFRCSSRDMRRRFCRWRKSSEMVEQTAMIASLAVTLVYFVTLGFIRGSEEPNHSARAAHRRAGALGVARTARRRPLNRAVTSRRPVSQRAARLRARVARSGACFSGASLSCGISTGRWAGSTSGTGGMISGSFFLGSALGMRSLPGWRGNAIAASFVPDDEPVAPATGGGKKKGRL